MEPLHTAPETSAFVLLADHQSRTPTSFHDGPAVLHYHSKQCKLSVLESDLTASPLSALRPSDSSAPSRAVNGSGDDDEAPTELVVDGVDVWVTSDKFLLYNPALSTGVSIPYPSISLHAIQRLRLPDNPDAELQGLYMQIATPSAPTAADDEETCMTLTVVPAPTTPVAETETDTDADADADADKETPTQKLYAAVSACANLHPDPMDEDDEENDGGDDALLPAGVVATGADGALPPPVDGSSGWITAENMHEFFDEEGNWIGGGEEPSLPLGPGAGTVRAREGETDDAPEDEEAKWRRTD
ncbi:regulator of volume decrease after cellular swelling-domain-containing protein [Aspergillus ambiguus]|uniref:Voldacs domain-containing protein n=1 Tax=Aspergillus ambiguus TaxID=176160 RepID=UPI003CCCF941